MLALLYNVTNLYTGIIFVFTLSLAWYLSSLPRLRNMPPGPFPLPVLGNFLIIIKDAAQGQLFKSFMKLKEKYGKIYSIKLGAIDFVVLNDYKLMQEAFVKNSNVFSNRPGNKLQFIQRVEKEIGVGVILSDGQGWKELRRVSMTAMRDFGVGKKSLEEKINEEVHLLLEFVGQKDGAAFYPKPLLSKSTSNVICSVIFGTRFDFDDPKFVQLLQHLAKALQGNPVFTPVGIFPFLRYIPGKLTKTEDQILHTLKETDDYIKELTSEHENTFDSDNIRDFVDVMINMRNTSQDKKHFTETNMRRVIVDLFVAGSDTTATSLYWVMLYLAANPDVQTKCQNEVDRVVGKGRRPTLADRPELSYVDATILEVLRLCPVAPLALPHSVTQDTHLDGFSIPQDTIVIANLLAINRDPNLWTDPNVFKPERFLDNTGRVAKRDRVFSFSVGPRSCLGELLAKMELFLYMVSMMQFCTIEPADPKKGVNLAPRYGTIYNGTMQDLRFIKR